MPIHYKYVKGFVLPLVMAILALLLILISHLAERYDLRLDQVSESKNSLDVELKIFNARNELIYRMLTAPTSPDSFGLNDDKVLLDDTMYLTKEEVQVQLQDARGLVGLNHLDQDVLKRLLIKHGITDRYLHEKLYDVLEDYKDNDDFKRLNGAEKKDYLELNLRPPRNAALLTPQELFQLIGWRDYSDLLRKSQFEDKVSVVNTVGINPNTASSEVLQVLFNLDEATANKLLELRKSGTVFKSDTFAVLIGLDSSALGFSTPSFPGEEVRLTLSDSSVAWKERSMISITPLANEKPWDLLYRYRIQAPTQGASAPTSIPLPEQKHEGPLQANTPRM